jgi:heme oxygenase
VDALAGLARARRQPALRDDLGALGRPVLPATSGIVELDGVAAAVGVMYVLEGSRLGGSVVARHVLVTLGPDVPCAFFGGGGVEPGRRWSAFRDAARAALVTTAEVERAVAEAARTFAAFATAVGEVRP